MKEKFSVEIEKPIFIVGAPRSGTTVLYSILGQHPDLGWFSKKTLIKFLTPEFLKFVYLRRRIFEMRGYGYPLDDFGPRFFTTVEPPIELGYLWDVVFPGYWDGEISEKKELLKKIILETLAENNKKRFLAKFPKLSIQIPLVLKVFPDAKFIHIIRDGRAVVNSMIKRSGENPSGYFGIPLKGVDINNMNKIEKHAIQWKQIIKEVRNVSKNLNKEQLMEVRYEDIVESPEDNLKRITEFCELMKFNFAYKKNGLLFNIEGKRENEWELMTIKTLEDPNKKYEKNLEIQKELLPELRSLGYI